MRFVMATGIMEIQCRRIWHAVRAYHRCALLSVPSESIAETAGLVLRDAATKAAGRPKPVDVFVRAAHIRLAGFRGHGGEEGVLSDALNLYFNARSIWRSICILTSWMEHFFWPQGNFYA